MRRKRRLDLAKTTPQKKRRMELKKKRVVEGRERIKWSKKHGQDTYYGGCSDSGDSDGGKMVCDSGDGVNQNKGKGENSNRGKGKPQGKGKCAACGSSTHQRSSHKDCPFHKSRAKKGAHRDHTAEEVIPASESGEDTSNGDSSDSQESEIDSCTCGAEGRAYKRGCPLSYSNRLPPGHALFPAPSNPRAHGDPSVLEPKHVSSPPESVKRFPSEDVKPEMKVGDYICIHSRNMGDWHVPCRIVGEFAGRYQLYCSKGILNTSFSCTELISLTGCSPIPLNEWRQAPRVSLRSVIHDAALREHCNCCVTDTSESIVISSSSEEENEALEMWVNNGAYTLSCRDREVVLSRRGWLTDKIICAAQMLLLQFFPNMAGLQPPTLQKVFAFRVHSGEFVQIIHVRNNHWCVVSTVGCQSGVVRVYDSLYKTLSKELSS